MKIYVDGELPKSCAECKILGVFDWCNYLKDCVSDEIKNNKRHVLCPLETTQSLKQQVRAEVVEQVNDYMKKHSHTIPVISKNRRVVYNIGLTRFLDQVKGKNNEI